MSAIAMGVFSEFGRLRRLGETFDPEITGFSAAGKANATGRSNDAENACGTPPLFPI
jgi:hypothetical protein